MFFNSAFSLLFLAFLYRVNRTYGYFSVRLYFVQVHHIKPLGSRVTRWQEDPFAGMAYSYIPVGCSSEIYDQLAAPISNKIFFAGEVIALS